MGSIVAYMSRIVHTVHGTIGALLRSTHGTHWQYHRHDAQLRMAVHISSAIERCTIATVETNYGHVHHWCWCADWRRWNLLFVGATHCCIQSD